jgi:hypothetical protein
VFFTRYPSKNEQGENNAKTAPEGFGGCDALRHCWLWLPIGGDVVVRDDQIDINSVGHTEAT